jgi:hypothetical protein
MHRSKKRSSSTGEPADLDGFLRMCKAQVALFMDNFHRLATEHIARTHHQRVARGPSSASHSVRAVVALGIGASSACSSFLETLSGLAASIMPGEVPMIGTPLFQVRAPADGVWPLYLARSRQTAFPYQRSPRLRASAARKYRRIGGVRMVETVSGLQRP